MLCLTSMEEIKLQSMASTIMGRDTTSETQKLFHRQIPKPPYRTVRDGRIVIGKYDTGTDIRYNTFVIDELLFFNHPVTEPEIKMLSK